ncbi:MAG: DcaP family trimeric outer membrane transporter [Pseudomonadota bacterium]
MFSITILKEDNRSSRGARRGALLLGTIIAGLTVSPAFAEESLEARVDALEGKLDLILQHLEGGAQLTPQQAVSVKDAAGVVKGYAEHSKAPATEGPRPILVELDTPGGVSAQSDAMAQMTPGAAPKPEKDGFKIGDAQVTFGGYVKLDAALTNFSGGELASNNIGRDFYIPALVPVGGEGDGADFDFNPRETRFIFDVKTNRGGHDIGGKIEFDFQVTTEGNERISNSFVPRMRQAYFTFDNWLLGQTWSTFQDVAALPDNLDFIGPTEGTVFNRQPMIRYTKGPWQIALEQPETEITTDTGGRILPGDDFVPDVVVRHNKKGDWGHVTAAGIFRVLHVEDETMPMGQEDDAFGYGISLSGKLKVARRDDIRFMATYGEGIGRYIGLNVVNDAAVDTNGELTTIETLSGFLSYRHFWTDNLRSNLTGGYFKADNPIDLVGDGVTDQVYSVHANIIYSPIKKFDVGFEYIYSNRQLESGIDGDMNKFQFSTKYSF